MSESGVSVVVTGTAWMGGGIGSIESALERLFRDARQEIVLTAYTISSSADRLFDWAEQFYGERLERMVVVGGDVVRRSGCGMRWPSSQYLMARSETPKSVAICLRVRCVSSLNWVSAWRNWWCWPGESVSFDMIGMVCSFLWVMPYQPTVVGGLMRGCPWASWPWVG